MKKNFFKKLSFVLALAMIVSVIAPAAGVFAASKPKLNASTKYLFLGQEDKEEYDFNISNKKTGWKYAWSSADKSVAVVNAKNGLTTAKKIGTTTVSVVIKDADGEEVAELSAKVIVKDNIKSVTIKAPAATKFSTNTDYDFNRSFVTDNGSTTKTTSVTRWTVSGTATISDSGVFKAADAGKYTITARAFQSKAKYAEWLALNDAASTKNVLATATYEVNVVASMVKAEQVDLDTFKVTFDTAVSDAATKLSVVNLVGTTEVANTVKTVTMSTDNKVATVDLYTKFTEGSTYVIKYPNMDNVQFVAATSNVADVKSMAVTSTTSQIGIGSTVDVALYNANGVNIADTDLLNRVTLASSNTAATVNGKVVTMYTLAVTTTITATFHTYTYDAATGTETGILTATGVLTCVDQEVDKATSITAYTVQSTWDNFNTINHNVAVGDTSYFLYVKFLVDVANSSDTKSWNNYNSGLTIGTTSGIQMTSSNTAVLIVDDTGRLYPVAAGTASVVVKYKDVVMGAVNVTVGTRREVSAVTLDTYSFTLSNAGVVDTKNVTISVKDQFGSTLDASKYTVNYSENTIVSQGAKVLVTPSSAVGTTTSAKYAFSGAGAAEGTNVYKITVTDKTSSKAIDVYVTVAVDTPTSTGSVHYYNLVADASTYDMKLNETSGDTTCTVNLNLYGYSTDGTKNKQVNVSGAGVVVTVKDPNGAVYAMRSGITTTGIVDLVVPTGGSIAKKATTGTWTVQAVSGGSQIIASTYFTVTDTQVAPVLTFDKYYVSVDASAGVTSKNDVIGALKACSTLTLKGNDMESFIQPLTLDAEYTGANGSYFINYIHVYETIDGGAGLMIDHKIAVNRNITIQ